MKRVFIIGSLVLAFIVAGCSDKANVESDQNSTNSEASSSEVSSGTNDTNGNSTMYAYNSRCDKPY